MLPSRNGPEPLTEGVDQIGGMAAAASTSPGRVNLSLQDWDVEFFHVAIFLVEPLDRVWTCYMAHAFFYDVQMCDVHAVLTSCKWAFRNHLRPLIRSFFPFFFLESLTIRQTWSSRQWWWPFDRNQRVPYFAPGDPGRPPVLASIVCAANARESAANPKTYTKKLGPPKFWGPARAAQMAQLLDRPWQLAKQSLDEMPYKLPWAVAS
jgi:hypothetical protein